MKRVLVLLVVGTVLSGMAAAYASTFERRGGGEPDEARQAVRDLERMAVAE